MAVILRGGTPNPRANSGFPLRNSIIEVAKDGSVLLTGADSKPISTLNLGYQGDHRVTQLIVRPWLSATSLSTGYDACLIFYSEKTKETYTASLNPSGSEYLYSIEDNITENGGNFQIFFVLKEQLSSSISGVGVAGEPAYREVFVSEVFKGAIDMNSGYQFMNGFNWDTDVEDYSKATIQLGDRSWTPNNDQYETQILLAGCVATSSDEIEVVLPEGAIEKNKQYNNKYLTLFISLDEGLELSKLDDIIIKYPLQDFSATISSNLAQKPTVVVDYSPFILKVEGNKVLGMKFDSYVTPIDVTSLQRLPLGDNEPIDNNTKKYTIFTKDNIRYVCPAIDNICWIPVGVTQKPGVWNVSFVVKNDSYIYYMEVLKLPVKDNILSREDLDADTLYSVARTSDGSILYEKNSKAVYVIAQDNDTANLDYTRDQINASIAWVNYIISKNMAPDDVYRLTGYIDNINTNLTNSIGRLEDRVDNIAGSLESTISRCDKFREDIETLDAEDAAIKASIAQLNEKIDSADTTLLSERLDGVEDSIQSLNENHNTQEEAITKHETSINKLIAKDGELNKAIQENAGIIKVLQDRVNNTHSVSIADHNERIKELETKAESTNISILGLQGVDIDLKADIGVNSNRIADLTTSVNALVDSDKKYWDELNNETANRAARDAELQKDIDDIEERFVRNADGYASEVIREAAHATDADNSIKLNGQDASYYAKQNEFDNIKSELSSGTFKVGLSQNTELFGGYEPEHYALESDLGSLSDKLDTDIVILNETINTFNSTLNDRITNEISTVNSKIEDNKTTLTNEINTKTSEINTSLEELGTQQQNTIERVNDLDSEINNIKSDTSFVRNTSFPGIYENYVAKIVVLEDTSIEKTAQMANVNYITEDDKIRWRQELITAGIIEYDANLNKNLTAEQVYDALKLKNKIEINTLYLLHEEE